MTQRRQYLKIRKGPPFKRADINKLEGDEDYKEEETPGYSSQECEVYIEDFETYNKTEYENLTGYPTFSICYPKGWEVGDNDLEDIGKTMFYNVYFGSNEKIELNTVSIGMKPVSLLDASFTIYNQEYSSKNPTEIIEDWIEINRMGEFWSEVELEENIDNTHFIVSYQDIDGKNKFLESSFFFNREGYLLKLSIFGIDCCFEYWVYEKELLEDMMKCLSIGDVEAEEEETTGAETTSETEVETTEKEDNSKATLYNQLDNISEEYNQAWNFFDTTYEEGPGVGIAQYDDPQWIAFDETYLAKQKELLSKLQSLNWLNYTEEKGTIIHYAHTLCAYFQAYIDSAKNHDPNGYNENWKKWGDLYFGDFTEYYNSVLEKLK
jgi:hypothetical protein